MFILWFIIFIVSLAVLVRGADWLLDGAEKIGIALGFSPFIVGVLLVGVGTSMPELISGIFAVLENAPEIVVANAIGSNVANILLVVGIAAVLAKDLIVTKSLIDLDLPLVALSTALLLGIAYDGSIVFFEAVLLVAAYIIYFLYTLQERRSSVDADEEDMIDVIPPPRHKRKSTLSPISKALNVPNHILVGIIGILGGGIALAIGANFLIRSVIELSTLLGIATGAIALVAVAFGTSLPEVVVSIKAARQAKSEVVLGNIFGSNVFNVLMVTGLPALFVTLPIDTPTLLIGLPALVIATTLFVVSGISRQIHVWEGYMYLLLYILFIGKLFGLI